MFPLESPVLSTRRWTPSEYSGVGGQNPNWGSLVRSEFKDLHNPERGKVIPPN